MTDFAGPPLQAPSQRAPGMVEVVVGPGQPDEKLLDAAVGTVTEAADSYGMGIMITRTGRNSFVVRAHPHVPAGLVRFCG